MVGVEKYAAGRPWDVQGPAKDACRFTAWLRDKQVPDPNIMLFLSPLEPQQGPGTPEALPPCPRLDRQFLVGTPTG